MSDEPIRGNSAGGSSGAGEWDGESEAWAAEADRLDDVVAPVTAALLAGARVESGQRVLELACGPGSVGLAAAVAVGPGGSVVCTDNSDEMLAQAAHRAETRGLQNVTTRSADLDDLEGLEGLDVLAGGFDAVVCRFGLMFASDPSTTVGHVVRLLRPDGWFAAAVWDERELNPWLGLALDAVGVELGMTVPPPGVPGPFSLAGDALRTALTAGGLSDVTVETIDVPRSWASPDEWFDETASLAGPVAALLTALGPVVAGTIADRAKAAAAEYTNRSTVAFPGRAIVAAGRVGRSG